jgi:hypothetical protein
VTAPQRFLLDSDVFIQAARQYYAFDLAPAFWQALVDLASNGQLLSIDRVKNELEQGRDELAQWVGESFHPRFASTNESDVLQAYATIMQWAQAQPQYLPAAKAELADMNNADAWLVAYAVAKQCRVVTQEQPHPDSRRKIFIPDVCQAFGVAFTGSFEMLRILGVRLG